MARRRPSVVVSAVVAASVLVIGAVLALYAMTGDGCAWIAGFGGCLP